MEELEKKYLSAQKALKAFRRVLDEPATQIIRDAAIQRFEFTFEIMWKTVQSFLKIEERITANSPKSVLREALQVNLLTEDETTLALEMTDDWNLTVHTYHEELEKKIYDKFPKYFELLKNLLARIKENSNV